MNALSKKLQSIFAIVGAYGKEQKKMLASVEIAKSPTMWALIVANFFSIFGISVLHWDIFTVIILFWAETIIVYLLTIIKMTTSALYRYRLGEHKPYDALAVMILYFFSYVAVSLVILASIAPQDATSSPFIIEHQFLPFMAFEYAIRKSAIGFLAFAGSHILSFFVNFIERKEYASLKFSKMTAIPHQRSGAGALAILIGAIVAYEIHSPAAFIPVIVIKIMLDVAAHSKEHQMLYSSS